MIILDNISDCTGCRACEYVCPKDAISMVANDRGFRYPQIDPAKCIECGLCRKHCPQNRSDYNLTLEARGAQIANDAIRRSSSSGGIFWALVCRVIDRGGVVFGVKFDKEWNICFDFGETLQQCEPFRMSKYAEADTRGLICAVKKKLDSGRPVMFVGTPCQVAAMRSVFANRFDNLLLVDLVCNSIPSSLVWKEFIKTVERKYGVIKTVNLRDKVFGWDLSSYTFKAGNRSYNHISGPGRGNRLLGSYTNLFFGKQSVRPGCFNCKYRHHDKRMGDITIGDFWHINEIAPERNDHKGLSIVLLNTEKGRQTFQDLADVDSFSVNINDLKTYGVLPVKNPKMPKNYDAFWKLFTSRGYEAAARRYTRYGLWNYFKGMILKPIVKAILRR